ncbi:hypothetical protein RD792_011718 [Penstemon davidsonii]|uniref:Transcription repressor n=1 Tax=Penstemon davidsonii TaxID=160366 RepID=A0ABR0CWF0_9LAMI|nr:hypothetical protein RD792_011718 [Penstemon davidsonii]
MGKKMKLFPFLLKPTESTTTVAAAASSWPWPTCTNNPKTLSFRATTTNENIYKNESADDPNSFFNINHQNEEIVSNAEDSSIILSGLRSNRLFFEPGETNSILEEAKTKSYDSTHKDKNVEIMTMDSGDPFSDFRVSMEEMVEAHRLKDWACLEELLTWYFRVNRKDNHGYIVAAFVDLLLHLFSSSAAIDEHCSSSSFTSSLSFTSSFESPISPCLENEDEIVVEKNVGSCGVSTRVEVVEEDDS